jgi:hypothetical protein
MLYARLTFVQARQDAVLVGNTLPRLLLGVRDSLMTCPGRTKDYIQVYSHSITTLQWDFVGLLLTKIRFVAT